MCLLYYIVETFSLTVFYINTFDTLESAARARENLNGADIYSGCCTLKIDFAKVSFLLLNIISIF